MNKAIIKSKNPGDNAKRDFVLLSNIVCILLWKMALDDKKAQDSWSSSQRGTSNLRSGKMKIHSR